MLHKKTTTYQPHPTTPLWTQEESIAYESACETIGHMIAICSSLIAKEQNLPSPNTGRINALEKMQLSLGRERINLQVKDHKKINQILDEYGNIINSYHNRNLPLVAMVG